MSWPIRRCARVLAVLAGGGLWAGSVEATDWPHYGGDPGGTRHSSLRQIHRGNVAQLREVWRFASGDARPGSTIECNPLVLDGVVYLTTPGLHLVALDADTGRLRWRYDPWDGRPGRGVNRGLATWSDGGHRRLFLPAGSHVHAIDAVTGLRVLEFGDSGRLDLRDGLDQDLFQLSVTASSPGVVYDDLLIQGTSVGEGPDPAAPGHIRAFDVRSGERRWIFHTIPHPGEAGHETWPEEAWKTQGGCNAWGGLTLDPVRGMVFAGTGSPAYDHYGGHRPGMNLFGNCVLALDARTGVRRWHFQTVHHDLWDYDLPCPPTLGAIRRRGAWHPVVAQPTKTGHVFVLDRITGKPVFGVEERRVPPSRVPGEQAWPTQPFPLRPPPLAAQGFGMGDVTDRSPAATAAVRKDLERIRPAALFEPPGPEPTVVLPQFNGGAEWGGAAFDPGTGWLYVNVSNEAEWISMVPARPRPELPLRELGAHLYRTLCSTCHGFGQPRLAASPSLASLREIGRRSTPEAVTALLRTGRGQMPSFAALSDLEHRAVIAFLFGIDGEETVTVDAADLAWAREIPWVATGHHEFRDPDGFPANRGPWGTLNAIDLTRGELVWQVPLGTYPALEREGLPDTGTFNIGGPIVTAGGLVFIGATMDERVRAFDADSGRELWEHPLPAGAYATPSTFSVRGRQYLLVAAGGGGKPGTRSGDTYHCFALPAPAE